MVDTTTTAPTTIATTISCYCHCLCYPFLWSVTCINASISHRLKESQCVEDGHVESKWFDDQQGSHKSASAGKEKVEFGGKPKKDEKEQSIL